MINLKLRDIQIININEENGTFVIEAETINPEAECPECQSTQCQGFGRKKSAYMDIPIRGKYVKLIVNKKRYRCKGCGYTFLEKISSLDSKRQMTARLLSYIKTQIPLRKNVSIAKEVGVSEKVIRIIRSEMDTNKA